MWVLLWFVKFVLCFCVWCHFFLFGFVIVYVSLFLFFVLLLFLWFFIVLWGWFVAKAFGGLGVTAGLAADRSALTGMSAGQQFFETDTKKLFMYSGSAWVLVSNLTLSYYPTFWVYKTAAITTAQTVIFDSVRENVGSNYSTTTGLFTAPVSGVYEFHASCINQISGTAWKFLKNGVIVSGPTPYSTITTSLWNTLSASVSTALTVGQTFGVSLTSGQWYGDAGNVHNHFSGTLISYS